jgi:hypothetical protein
MKTSFDHEKLDVYQESIRFVSSVDELLEEVPRGLAVHNQLDRASFAAPLPVAFMKIPLTTAHGQPEKPIRITGTITITITIRRNPPQR